MNVGAMSTPSEAEQEDPQRRYEAVYRRVEQGLSAAVKAPRARLPELYAEVAGAALQELEREPCEPRLLNYAGVALYELWSLRAAGELFDAALRLDPQLADARRNLAQLTERRRARRGAKREPVLHPAVAELERRALAVAPRAQPAEGLRLSLCMIVRDEQEMLGRCLEAVSGRRG